MYDPKLVEAVALAIEDELHLRPDVIARIALRAIDTSGTHLVIPVKCPWEDDPFEPLGWDDMITAYLAERRGEG